MPRGRPSYLPPQEDYTGTVGFRIDFNVALD
jgi:hypothetical protein